MSTAAADLQKILNDAEARLNRLIAARQALLALPARDSTIERQTQFAQESIVFAGVQIAQLKEQVAQARGREKEGLAG